MAICRYYKQ